MFDPPLLHPIFAPIAFAVLGAIFGSFIGAIVARWPRGESVLSGRSHCDGCGRTLGAAELLPVLSWLAQRGRCRACGAAIGGDALAIEALAAVIGAVAIIVAPGWQGVAGAVFGWLLLALGWIDFRHFWLPDSLTAMLAATGLGLAAAGMGPPLLEAAITGIVPFAALWLVAIIYKAVRGREGLGGGDPKLLGALGFWLGAIGLNVALLLACLLGLVAAGTMALSGRSVTGATRLPLGTLFAIAGYLVWLAQQLELVPR